MNWNPEFSFVGTDERAEAILHQRAPENFLLAREPCEPGQVVHRLRRKITFEQWHELLANPRTLPAQVAIRRIFAPVLPELPQILSQVFAPLAKQRPHNRTHR